MTLLIQPEKDWTTNHLLAAVLSHCKSGERVQFLVEPRVAASVVQRLRVALSRSRNRHKVAGKKIEEFTLRHSIHPYTNRDGKRHSCVVMWVEKQPHHVARELLDDLMERES
jgi:hypothetical protein